MLFVNNLADLLEDIERYKQQFPGSYTPYSEIMESGRISVTALRLIR